MKPQNHAVLVSGDQLIEVASVALNNLIIDPSYQRTEFHSGKRIAELSEKLDFHIAGLLKAVKRSDGKLAIVDGGSRLTSIRHRYPNGRHPDGSLVYVAAQIMPGKGRRAEAKLTEDSNLLVKRFHSNSMFKTRLAGGGAAEIEIMRQLEAAGVTLMFGSGATPANHTNSAGAFRRVYDIVGRARFHEVIEILQTYQRPNFDGTIERDALRPDFMIAIAKLLVAKERSKPYETWRRHLAKGYSAADIFFVCKRKEKNGGGENRRNILVEAIRESAIAGGENEGGARITARPQRPQSPKRARRAA